ncbi:MAG: DNA starvation/stationary phase protection protein [Gammaproteobacteria bacterium]|nr:DNA starvation/stationary phase protection protein [Gammaproteobacteria bacterium]
MNTALNIKRTEQKPMDIGVDRRDRKELADELSIALADSYVLYGLTQHVHWNVTGPLFYGVHKMTEEQYQDLGTAIDDLAERIRAIGFVAPGGIHQMLAMTRMDTIEDAHDPHDMLRLLINGNEACARTLRAAVSRANEYDDVKTSDLLTDRIGQHEENTWMLRAILS